MPLDERIWHNLHMVQMSGGPQFEVYTQKKKPVYHTLTTSPSPFERIPSKMNNNNTKTQNHHQTSSACTSNSISSSYLHAGTPVSVYTYTCANVDAHDACLPMRALAVSRRSWWSIYYLNRVCVCVFVCKRDLEFDLRAFWSASDQARVRQRVLFVFRCERDR